MEIAADVYRALEDIVGPENISCDHVILDGYAFQGWAPVGVEKKDRFFYRPVAVVLPGSTEDVQALIKACRRFRLKSKAFCTGYGAHCANGSEDVVLMDLRRMNRILELDEKNMYVVVEPYVSFAQVQVEAMKRGLSCHVIAAGSQASFLASHTSMHGNNIMSISHGYSGRNLLGVEWVLPTGEVLRLGAPGSGTAWFSGDGPGPSLRGIMRGAVGAMGGLGVFTKCAGHLHPWPGAAEMEVKGISPEYETEVPDTFAYHIVEFPSWEQYAEAVYRIGEAGIAFALHKTGGPGTHGAIVTASNDEYWAKRQAGELAIPWISFSLVLAGKSPREHQYQVKVLDRILEETGGKISPVGEDPTFQKRDYLTMIKACFIPRLAFRLTGSFTVDGFLGTDTMDMAALGLKMDEVHRNKYAARGVIMDDGTLNSWGAPFEGTHFSLFECGHQFSPTDAESIKGMEEMGIEGMETTLKTPFAMSWGIFMDERVKELGPLCYNLQDWLKKIKRAFDPDTVSDPVGYVSADS